MTQIGFPRSEAHEALDQFLADPDGMGRWIGEHDDTAKGGNPDYGETVAHIVGGKSYEKTLNGYHQWLESQEVREELADEPVGYKPWHHSPLASTDRLLPREPLEDPLARAITGKPFSELPEDEQWHIRAHAINLLLRVQLDPDGQGAVPVMMAGHDQDEPGEVLRWQIAFTTPVPGLYVRCTANGFFGEEWGILTGSGYRIAQGWYSRDEVTRCAEALGRVLPNCDWMRLTPSGFTPRAMAAISAVIKRYRQYGLNEKEPEPEVMAGAVPEDAAGVKSGA